MKVIVKLTQMLNAMKQRRSLNSMAAFVMVTAVVCGASFVPAQASQSENEGTWRQLTHQRTVQVRKVTFIRGGVIQRDADVRKRVHRKSHILAMSVPSRRFTTFKKPQIRVASIYGRAAWVCTPSGFGRKAQCFART